MSVELSEVETDEVSVGNGGVSLTVNVVVELSVVDVSLSVDVVVELSVVGVSLSVNVVGELSVGVDRIVLSVYEHCCSGSRM